MKKNLVAGFLLALVSMSASAADNPLYPTGPSQDSSFVRFINASDDKASIVNGAAKVNLTTQGEGRASRFYPVAAGTKLLANVQVGSAKLAVEVVAKPGEFVTVGIIGKDKGIDTVIVKESPTDFNASRSSIGFMNLDASCAAAGLHGGAKNTMIFEAIKPGNLQRRLVNPVSLSVQAHCDGKEASKAVDLGQLQAGERYSVVLMPGKKGPQAFFVRDSTS